jgi:hypothetical protein
MSDKKSWGSTVMGWFVVQDQPQQADKSTDYVPFSDDDAAIKKAAGAEPQLDVFTSPPPAAPGGDVDYDKVFEAAGIDTEERERVKRTQDLLTSLPPGTDEAVKKQIVMASLKAFAVPVEQIVEATAQELQALEAYIRAGAADTEKVTSEADLRIKQYEEEIVKLKSVMQERVSEQQAVIKRCNEKKLEIQKVLEFFGQETVARVVQQSSKLKEPTA